MHDDRAITEARIRRAMADRIRPAIHGPHEPLTVTAHHVDGEPISFEAARNAAYQPFEVGDPWGRAWGTTWFHLVGAVPARWAGASVEALVHFAFAGLPGFGAEAQVWTDEGPLQGLHPDHRAIRIAEPAAGGEAVELWVEAAANPNLQTSFAPTPFGDLETLPDFPLYRLGQASLAVRNDEVRELWLDMRTLAGLMGQLPADEPRRHEILRALEKALDALDLADVAGTASRARPCLEEVLSRPAHASAHRISAVGHAHIDTAWMWPLRETVRKCARTFSTAVGLMDEFPEYRFACSQAVQYQWMKDHYPRLYARIRQKVDAGQFVPVGGMWVEADCNIPSGESLVRQFVHGKRFFAEEFGVEPREVWIPDVFGYAANLPQLMRKAGCDSFLTQKLSWNKTNRFPHHTFLWEGIDGSRVFTHFPPAETYNGLMKPAELIRGSKNFADHGFATMSLYPFGHGDGGGGPTREMLEMADRMRDLEGCPPVTIEPPAAFFEKAKRDYEDPPVWRGELYLEMHRGTYTTQAKTKWGNRRGEALLREAELWATVAAVHHQRPYPRDLLDQAWKTLLLHQFHDIIPGSSIAWVHHDTERDHAEVHDAAESAIRGAASALVAPDQPAPTVTFMNAASHGRREVAFVDAEHAEAMPPGALAAIDRDGARHPVQRLASGEIATVVEVPALGANSLRFVRGGEPSGPVRVEGNAVIAGARRISWNDAGLITSLGDDLLDPMQPANLFQVHPDHPNEYDAWDLDRFYRNAVDDLTEVDSIEVLDDGPLVARVRFVRSFGESRIEQVMQVTQDRVDFVTDVDWREHEKVLKVAWPTTIRADHADYEVQFGHVRRPTHENTSWDFARFEVCAHRWAALREPGRGLALLNDCKYGHEAVGSTMRLTLLRSPKFPDPNADIGHHRFTYSVLPFDGGLRPVVDAGAALNLPLRSVAGGASVESIARCGEAVVEAVKLAEDGTGDVVIRLYEPLGRRTSCDLTLSFAFDRVAETDLLERDQRDLDATGRTVHLTLGPFEVMTLRFRPSRR